MTHYLLSVWGTTEPGDQPYGSEEAMQEAFAAVEVFNEQLRADGKWVFAGGLHPAETATVVSVGDDDRAVVTDGPYAETKETIGGFWVIDATDLDEALRLAEAGARACRNPVEVRPFQAE